MAWECYQVCKGFHKVPPYTTTNASIQRFHQLNSINMLPCCYQITVDVNCPKLQTRAWSHKNIVDLSEKELEEDSEVTVHYWPRTDAFRKNEDDHSLRTSPDLQVHDEFGIEQWLAGKAIIRRPRFFVVKIHFVWGKGNGGWWSLYENRAENVNFTERVSACLAGIHKWNGQSSKQKERVQNFTFLGICVPLSDDTYVSSWQAACLSSKGIYLYSYGQIWYGILYNEDIWSFLLGISYQDLSLNIPLEQDLLRSQWWLLSFHGFAPKYCSKGLFSHYQESLSRSAQIFCHKTQWPRYSVVFIIVLMFQWLSMRVPCLL